MQNGRSHTHHRPLPRYGGGSPSTHADAETDDMEEELVGKVGKLKQITINLGDHIKSSHGILSDLDNSFERSRGVMAYAMGRVSKLAASGGHCKLYCYLILFCMFVFFVLYLVIKFF